jgi:signal transduction histidine kinase
LAAALLVLILLSGTLFFFLVRYATEMYQQEVQQRLNTELAQHIVADTALFKASKINQDALRELFHMMMVINPSIEVYLLDNDGKILADAAPYDRVKREQVAIEPIRRFVNKTAVFPEAGDDPRDPKGSKVFSAAPLVIDGEQMGYLYVILGGEEFDHIAALIEGSYIFRISVWGLVASLTVVLLFGLFIFAFQTQRLRKLTRLMHRYVESGDEERGSLRYENPAERGDEIDRLAANFNVMADRISQQVQELKRNDAQRRELVANVSHDLRTPLATLNGYLETLLLKENELDTTTVRRYVEIAFAHSKRLGELVADLFELATLDSCETLLSVEPFSMGELVQDVLQKFQLQAETKHLALETNVVEELPFAYGDIGLMQRVLENLIENAIRHTPAGGKVSVSLTPAGSQISVRVADTGCGIPAGEIDFIFDRFYRLTKSREGDGKNAGLGLAIVKRILDLHGSVIKAESRKNKGTSFTFTLPAYTR